MARTPSRLMGLLRTLWLLIGASLLALLLIEGVLRATFSSAKPKSSVADANPERRQSDAYAGADWVDDYWEEFHDSKEMTWHPWVMWRRLPYAGRYIHVDAQGLRRTWSPDAAPAGAAGAAGSKPVLIHMFGGSTMWGTGARDEFTIPSFVAQRLHAAGVAATVVNFGESGWVSRQELAALESELAAGSKPDVAVFYDGVNDCAAALQSGRPGLPQNVRNRQLEFNLGDDTDRMLERIGARLFKGVQRLAQRLQPEPAGPGLPPDLGRQVAADCRRTLSLAQALGEQQGFITRFYSQPMLFTKQTPTPYERSVIDASLDAQSLVYVDFVDAVRDPTALPALPGFRDLTGLLDHVPQPVFIDFCHLSESGNALVADAICDDLLAALGRR